MGIWEKIFGESAPEEKTSNDINLNPEEFPFSEDEEYEDVYENQQNDSEGGSDDDEDRNGGEMMPIPGML
jgi:hypothetical protein